MDNPSDVYYDEGMPEQEGHCVMTNDAAYLFIMEEHTGWWRVRVSSWLDNADIVKGEVKLKF